MTVSDRRTVAKSEELYAAAREIILGGTQTLSKQPERYLAGRHPAYAERGKGGRLFDLDGNEYIDFVLALGPIVLGYCDPDVDGAVRDAMDRGVLLSANSPLEVELAERLVEIVPCAEKVRYFKSGADACSAAVRVSRHYTGRKKIVSCGYSGWHDWWVAKRGESGVPGEVAELTIDLPYGNIARAEAIFAEHGEDIAAVIVETVVMNLDAAFLAALRSLATKHGAVLVFDEIIAGFRLALAGAQEYTGIEPDLAVYGKAIANGYPLAVLTGTRPLMDAAETLWISATYGGECLSLAAALATIEKITGRGVLRDLAEKGERLRAGWLASAAKHPAVQVVIGGLGSLPSMSFASAAVGQEDIFLGEMLDRGFLTRRGHYWFTCAAHTPADIDAAVVAVNAAFARISAIVANSGEARDV